MRSARVWERRIDLSGTERLADRAHRSTYGFEERAARIKCQRSAACLASGSARVTACPYLSRQTLDIMIALKTYAGSSRYLLPSRYDADTPMSRATFNRVTYSVVELAKKEGLPLEPFTVHDLRRTGSTLLNELGFNSDWIEKCLAHEDGRSSRGIYNKAEYEVQRRPYDAGVVGYHRRLGRGQEARLDTHPPSMPLLGPDPALEPGAIAVA